MILLCNCVLLPIDYLGEVKGRVGVDELAWSRAVHANGRTTVNGMYHIIVIGVYQATMLLRQLLHVFLDVTLGWRGTAASLLRTPGMQDVHTAPNMRQSL